MPEIIIRGKRVVKGNVSGEALISHEPISFKQSVDASSGIIIEKNHELEGICITGKILIFPTGKGSTGGSFRLLEMARKKTLPRGIINLKSDPIIVAGAIIVKIPMLDRVDPKIFDLIKSGDFITLDANREIIKLISK